MYGDAPISENEARDLVCGFFHAVHLGGSAGALEPMFAPGVMVETWVGPPRSLEAHLEVHARLVREQHTLLETTLVPLADGRVRVIGEVEWEAVVRDTGAIIQAVVDADWILERAEDGRVRFARCAATGIRYLPGSATLEV